MSRKARVEFMNKKFLTVAASLLLALPMTVAAAPSPTTGTIAGVEGQSEVQLVGSASEAENLGKPAVWVEDGNEISDASAKSAAGNLLTGAEKLCEFEIEANALAKEKNYTVKLTVKLSKAIPEGKVGYVFHFSSNGIKAVSGAFTGSSVTITVNTGDLSPFVVVIGDAKDAQGGNNQGGNNQGGNGTGGKTSPGTSDSNKSVLWGSIAMISLACAAGLVVARRRNA